MCGICGLAAKDGEQPVSGEALREMTALLEHRGPDSSGLHLGPGVGLGVHRLSIIDPEGGDQPITNEDRTLVVVCNGEVYNAPELRRELQLRGHSFRSLSDVEVIVHLYEETGIDLVERLRGMFAFALWDAPRRRLVLARDRLGIKPMHYAACPRGLCFGSESKAILASGWFERRLEPRALVDLFDIGFVVSPLTLAAGVRRLAPGHVLVYSGGEVTTRRYWQPRFPARGCHDEGTSADEWAERLRDKLREVVRLHLRSDVPIGAWLSPGLDSNTVASLMCESADMPVPTFSLAFEDSGCDELRRNRTVADYPGYTVEDARAVCRNDDLALLPKAVWHAEDLSLSAVEIPRMVLARLAASRVKVVLTGEGADELFGGYRWYHGDKLLRPLARLPVWARRCLQLGSLGEGLRPRASRLLLAPARMAMPRFRAMVAPDRADEGMELLSPEVLASAGVREDHLEGPPDWLEALHPFNQVQYFDLTIRMPDFVVRDLDRSSMAYSVEARVPFLDHELVQLASRIPPRLMMRWFKEKYILRRAMQHHLPAAVAQRVKRGLYAPVERWTRGPLPDFARELLSPKRLRENGYFRPETVGRWFDRLRRDSSAGGRQLLGVLSVQLWHELFVRRKREVSVA